jgi:hypothetical protein
LSDKQFENASGPIRLNFESGSNETVESESQKVKQFSERISTKGGIHIDWSFEQSANVRSSICRN